MDDKNEKMKLKKILCLKSGRKHIKDLSSLSNGEVDSAVKIFGINYYFCIKKLVMLFKNFYVSENQLLLLLINNKIGISL